MQIALYDKYMTTKQFHYGESLRISDLSSQVTVEDVLESIDDYFEETLAESAPAVLEALMNRNGGISAKDVDSILPELMTEVRAALNEALADLANRAL